MPVTHVVNLPTSAINNNIFVVKAGGDRAHHNTHLHMCVLSLQLTPNVVLLERAIGTVTLTIIFLFLKQ